MSSSSNPQLLSYSNPSTAGEQHDNDNGVAESSSSEDEETLRRLMVTFGSKQVNFDFAVQGEDSNSSSDAESSANDDISYLRHLQEQFLLPAAFRTSCVAPQNVKPIRAFSPFDTDDDDDLETLRAIQRRFSHYGGEAPHNDFSLETNSAFPVMNEVLQEQNCNGWIQSGEEFSSLSVFPRSTLTFFDGMPQEAFDNVPEMHDTPLRNRGLEEDKLKKKRNNFNQEDGSYSLSSSQFISSRFSESVQSFVNALKKNRSCQRFIREKLIKIEAKIEVNRILKERLKYLMDFHTAYKRKMGLNLSQKRDPRVKLISHKKQRPSNKAKENLKKNPALYFTPAENSQTSNYKMVMNRFPFSLKKRQWSDIEKDKLINGVKQQCQEILFLNSIDLASGSNGLNNSTLMPSFKSTDYQVTPEILNSFVRFINWDRLASMYLPKHSGSSCESRWFNHENPMINTNPWTSLEDKKLLFTIQDRGLYNWIGIASALGSNRTPFQCLARYQRSLNPHILNREWTNEEDTKVCAAVETFGENNWQAVASHLDGRTSNQCSIRWRNTLLPKRKKVGRWSVDEDKQLKVAVIFFGAKNWKKIAQFISGRTQSQCRERWLNCLDPSLNLERWTQEEDEKLLSAITEHGHCWSKVAFSIAGRTDNQCRRRWKILRPHEVPILKAAQQLKKTVLISNFVGRKSERPAIGPTDFTPVVCLPDSDYEKPAGSAKKRARKKSRPGGIIGESSLDDNITKVQNKFKILNKENSKNRNTFTSLAVKFSSLSLAANEALNSTATGFIKRKSRKSLKIGQSKSFKSKRRDKINGSKCVEWNFYQGIITGSCEEGMQ